MSTKLEGKPPFYLGIAEVASAHALDESVVLRAGISVPELRPKSVRVQLIVAADVAKALAEQLPIAVKPTVATVMSPSTTMLPKLVTSRAVSGNPSGPIRTDGSEVLRKVT